MSFRTPAIRPRLALALILAAAAGAVAAQSPAASACPPIGFLSDNLAVNTDFETPMDGVPAGSPACWQLGDPVPANSAAAGWQIHTSNAGDPVCTWLLPGGAPGPGGQRAISVRAGGNEGGLYQAQALDPRKSYMFSVWVKVRRGQVAIASRATTGGPVAWSTKLGEWEQLRVCTNSLSNTDLLTVYNQAAGGGSFTVDRVELREIPTLE